MRYTQITVETTSAGSEMVAYTLIEAGSEGVIIKDSNDLKELARDNIIWDYIDPQLLVHNELVLVTGFYPENFADESLKKELTALKEECDTDYGSLKITAAICDSADWENIWKQFYVPIEAGNLVIVPEWIKYDASDKKQVRLNPGMAFGTGKHETTKMCLDLMQLIELDKATVADIGCGSGILGISALVLGAKKCFFTDIDEQAITATAENLQLNDISDNFELIHGDLADFESKVDVVFANLTADILLRLFDDIERIIKHPSYIVISGIINERAKEVTDAFSAKFTQVKRLKDGEWQAFLYRAE